MNWFVKLLKRLIPKDDNPFPVKNVAFRLEMQEKADAKLKKVAEEKQKQYQYELDQQRIRRAERRVNSMVLKVGAKYLESVITGLVFTRKYSPPVYETGWIFCLSRPEYDDKPDRRLKINIYGSQSEPLYFYIRVEEYNHGDEDRLPHWFELQIEGTKTVSREELIAALLRIDSNLFVRT